MTRAALIAAGVLVALATGAAPAVAAATPRWQWDLAGGVDSYLYTYALATTDTSETITEALVQAGLTGRSAASGRHRWRTRVELSAGTALYRQRLEGDYRLVDAGRIDRLRLSGRFWGRQYRDTSEYSRTSDNWEGRLEAVATPVVASGLRLEARGVGSRLDYAQPSTLEVDRRTVGGGLFVRGLPDAAVSWGVGGRAGHTSYPDSAAIDRDTWSLEADLDTQTRGRTGVRLYHRSERRQVRDETVRPSAWTHWTDLAAAVAAGAGQVVVESQLEAWQYDAETDVYFDSTRLQGLVGYRWGDVLATTWQLGLTGERLAAGQAPESYGQFGLRGSVESWAGDMSGSFSLEYGRRVYDDGDVTLVPPGADPTLLDVTTLYTDFTYWRLWLLAAWRIAPAWDVDLMASYEPESHTERADDTTLGFASLRLRWRPGF